MWTYKISTGQLFDPSMVQVGKGWAGRGSGQNNINMIKVHDTGPLPIGKYTIMKPMYSHLKLGPKVLNLMPFKENEMFGRSEFRIHGASKSDPANSSHGCIIMPPLVRVTVNDSTDNILNVIA